MSGRKMLQVELDPPYEISWAEKEAIVFHCLRARDENPSLLDWLRHTTGDVLIHVTGKHILPDVIALDMENMTEVNRRSAVHDCEEDFEFVFEVSKSEAIRIAQDGALDNEKAQSAIQVYTEVMKPRFEGEPFVYLTCDKRATPLRVPLS